MSKEPDVATTISAAVACLCTLAYCGMKTVMAIRGELGLPGFPAPAASYRDRAGIAQDEWTLVALGIVAAAIAVLPLTPAFERTPVWISASVVWMAALSQAAGAAGMTLRAFRILPDLGPGPQSPTTWIVLLVLDVGAVAWLALAALVTRRGIHLPIRIRGYR